MTATEVRGDKETWSPRYEPWRHGGWYVTNVQYPSGAVGCVSRNFADKKWRIVNETSVMESSTVRTFPNRDAAARAERESALAEWANVREDICYPLYRRIAEALTAELRDYVGRYAHTDVVLRVACRDVHSATREAVG